MSIQDAASARPTRTEFVALMAMLLATVAFSIDSMLPALPEIAAELTAETPNRAQLIITSFVLGMGVGTFFTGALSDRFGRKPVVIGGAVLYILAAALAWAAPSLELMLAARFLQGLGAAAPRVVGIAMIRDLYSGREMARLLSFVLLVFSLVPALAPTLGAGIIALTGWRGIFVSFVVFALAVTLWLALRQPETLAPENRRPLRWDALRSAVREVLSHPTARLATMVQTLSFAMLFTVLSSTQPVFDQVYGQGAHFHLWFGGIALVAATSSLVNARFVIQVGMRGMIKGMLTAQIGLTTLMAVAVLAPLPPSAEFALYVIWTASLFFQAGLTIGNLNALALEPMGHIAGTAASVITAVATVGSVLIAVPIGLSFNGTPLPITLGILVCAALALWLTTKIRRDSDPD